MRKAIAVLIGVLLPFLGLAGVGQAQSAIQVQGTIQSVDCQNGTVELNGPTGSNTLAATDYTAVLVNSTSVPFCTLQQYVGAPATVWLVASGSEFEVTRIDVLGPAAVAYPPAPVVTVAPLSIVGVVLGTVAVAGLLYLLVHDNDGHFYRYPYYGDYYHYYYRETYRPYIGYWPQAAPVIFVPASISGIVIGTTVIGGLAYLLARDHDGRVYRYPYYGPYHQYYYGSAYRPYAGDYHQAPLRQGDPHWTARANTTVQGQPKPVPVRQQAPAYHGGNQAPATQQYDRGRSSSGSPASHQQCGGRGSNQGCSNGGR